MNDRRPQNRTEKVFGVARSPLVQWVVGPGVTGLCAMESSATFVRFPS